MIILFIVFTLYLRAASLRRVIGAKGGGDVTRGGVVWGGEEEGVLVHYVNTESTA